MCKYLIVSDNGTTFKDNKLEYALDTAHEYVFAMGGIAEVFKCVGKSKHKIAVFVGVQSVGLHLLPSGVEYVRVNEYDEELDKDDEYVEKEVHEWDVELKRLTDKLGG